MRITIFCGASTGENPVYSEKTVALAQWMAQNKHLWCMVEEKLA